MKSILDRSTSASSVNKNDKISTTYLTAKERTPMYEVFEGLGMKKADQSQLAATNLLAFTAAQELELDAIPMSLVKAADKAIVDSTPEAVYKAASKSGAKHSDVQEAIDNLDEDWSVENQSFDSLVAATIKNYESQDSDSE